MTTTKVATIPVDRKQHGVASVIKDGKTDADGRAEMLGGKLRHEAIAEIEAMALFLLSDGRLIGEDAADLLSRLEQQEAMPLGELIALHGYLAQELAPAKPRSVLSLQQGQTAGRWSGYLGPTPGVRRLTVASLFFALTFFLISLSGEINLDAMSKSIYELSGVPLAVKLGLIVSAAGMGASFAALFSVWEDLRNHRYEPLAESASWMQVGLGLVAGLMLAEIIGGEEAISAGGDAGAVFGGASEPLLALLGGFSAGVIHLVLNSIVNAIKRALGHEDRGQDQRELTQLTLASLQPGVASSGTPSRRSETTPMARRGERAPQNLEDGGDTPSP